MIPDLEDALENLHDLYHAGVGGIELYPPAVNVVRAYKEQKYEEQEDGWTSTKEFLPTHGQRVLWWDCIAHKVWLGTFNSGNPRARSPEARKDIFYSRQISGYAGEQATHWMPLPGPPK